MANQYDMVPASDLVEDFDVYPREDVDSTNVSRLSEALRAQADLVLRIVADRATKRVVDGMHTRRAYLRVFGADVRVPVEWRDYPDEKALYLDAIALNARHGKPITGSSMVHALLRGVDKGIDEMALAEIFGIRTEKVAEIVKLRMGIVSAPTAKGKDVKKRSVKSETVPLKNSVRHMWGHRPELTPEQARAHASGPGTPGWLMLKQVADYVECDLFDTTDSRVMEQLVRLRGLLVAKMKKTA